MLARIRKAKETEGFTLIELLVVIIIIGILAAVAIPVFLNQRNKGYDAAVKSDLRNAATAQETYLTENDVYSAQTPVAGDLTGVGFKYSSSANYDANTAAIAVTLTAANGTYCMDATAASGNTWKYDSAAGGVSQGAC